MLGVYIVFFELHLFLLLQMSLRCKLVIYFSVVLSIQLCCLFLEVLKLSHPPLWQLVDFSFPGPQDGSKLIINITWFPCSMPLHLLGLHPTWLGRTEVCFGRFSVHGHSILSSFTKSRYFLCRFILGQVICGLFYSFKSAAQRGFSV